MGVATAGLILRAAEDGGGTSNFLIPNGTFFFILAIFLVVFGVITKFVVQPVQKVLDEREQMLHKTGQDNRQASEQDAAADAEYRQELAGARNEAGAIRDQARAEGRQTVEDMRAQASTEVAGRLAAAEDTLRGEGAALEPTLNASVESLAQSLADRVLGTGAAGSPAQGRGQ